MDSRSCRKWRSSVTSVESITDVEAKIVAIQSRTASPQLSGDAGAQFQAVLNSAMQQGGVLGSSDALAMASVGPHEVAQGSATTGSAIVKAGMKYLGIPYVWGGNDPKVGLDCSSLVQRVYADYGIKLPRVAADQARQGTAVPSLAQAKPGDLVAFGSPVDHIGIYVGDNKMLVAPKRGDVVKVQEVYKAPTAIRRILPESPGGAQPTSFGQTLPIQHASYKVGLQSSFDSLFKSAEAKYGVPAALLAAVAKQESGFNPTARSRAGAVGLMQFMPATAKGLGIDPLVPSQAVDGAARLLLEHKSKFGSYAMALAAYNAGPGAVQRYGGIPPFKETQNYVKNVLTMSGVTG